MLKAGRVAPKPPITQAWRNIRTHEHIVSYSTDQQTVRQEREDDLFAGLNSQEPGQDSNSQPTVTGCAVELITVLEMME